MFAVTFRPWHFRGRRRDEEKNVKGKISFVKQTQVVSVEKRVKKITRMQKSTQRAHIYSISSAFCNSPHTSPRVTSIKMSVMPAPVELPSPSPPAGDIINPRVAGLIGHNGPQNKQPFMVAFFKATEVHLRSIRSAQGGSKQRNPNRSKGTKNQEALRVANVAGKHAQSVCVCVLNLQPSFLGYVRMRTYRASTKKARHLEPV